MIECTYSASKISPLQKTQLGFQVVDSALEVSLQGIKAQLGTVVVRGNSVITMEVLDHI